MTDIESEWMNNYKRIASGDRIWYIATEIDRNIKNEHSQYFIFPLDGDKDFDECSRISISEFYSNKNNWNENSKLVYHLRDIDNEYLDHIAVCLKTANLSRYTVPVPMELNSLWEF